MQELIKQLINDYVRIYPEEQCCTTRWGEPVAAFAAADDPRFLELKTAVGPSHAMPQDLVPGARTVIAYFIPLAHEIVKSNIVGKEASTAWALAYIETNRLIRDLNEYLYTQLQERGFKCSRIPPTHNFDVVKLISDWSHRHVAVIAGLGVMGLNNMLITERGCAGRIGSLVTDMEITPTAPLTGERCLYKYNGSCRRCVERCVNMALHEDSFDRHRCYEMCLANEALHAKLGKADVCGKCLAGTPCSFTNPVKRTGGR